MPTVLTLLGLPVPAHVDGRVLWEGFIHPLDEPGARRDEVLEPATPTAYAANPAKLRLHHVGTSSYLHGALQNDVDF